MTSLNLQNQKQGTSTNKSTGTVLTPSEISSLRQDLKQAVKFGEGFFKQRATLFKQRNK